MALEKGTTLAGYEITGILGQGGMGVVYEATQVSLQRTVALKVLAPHLSEDVLFRERFRREGQIQAGIDHQHIVTVYEAGETEHGFFIAMRLIRGPNLKDLIISRVLDPGRTLRILSPISQALDAAHDAGLIHRDIKPQNILVGGRDQAFLADFGLTKASGEKSLTRTGQFVGTFDYISPEQIKGERATQKSDVYALAAVLYECLTGVVPFPKDSEAAVLYAQMTDPPPKVTDQRPELPATLDHVILTGMAKDPDERYDSPGRLLLETNRAFTRRMRAAFTPPGPLEAPQETGIRSAEQDVSTRQSPAQDYDPATERGALEAETMSPAERGETVRSPEPAPPEPVREDPGETAIGQTAASAAPPPAVAPPETAPAEAVPVVTAPSAEPPPAAPAETAPGETAPAAEPPQETAPTAEPAPPETAPGEAIPAETAPGAEPPAGPPGETAPGEPAVDEPPSEEPPDADRRPWETPVTAALPNIDVTRPGQAEPALTKPASAGIPTAAAATAAGAGGAGAATPPAPTARDRARPKRRAGAGPVLAAVGLLLLAVLVIGFLVGRSGGGTEEEAAPAAESSVAPGALEMSYPAETWERDETPLEIPGIDFGQQIALKQKVGSRQNSLLAGFTQATGPALLPAQFLNRLDEEPARTDAVKLGDLDAYRYRNLLPEGFDGRLTMYVAPTTRGVATVACTATAASQAKFLPACEEVAGSLKLLSGKEFPLGADKDYVATLEKTINRLNKARKQDVTKLKKATKRAGQAREARKLEGDYRRAERSLPAQSKVSPAVRDASAKVTAALARTRKAYGRLAGAARNGRGSAYNAAIKDIKAGDKALNQALRQVEEAG